MSGDHLPLLDIFYCFVIEFIHMVIFTLFFLLSSEASSSPKTGFRLRTKIIYGKTVEAL